MAQDETNAPSAASEARVNIPIPLPTIEELDKGQQTESAVERLTKGAVDIEEAIQATVRPEQVEVETINYDPHGTVAKPKESSLRGYKQALKRENDTRFSPQLYTHFDGIIIKECGVDRDGFSIFLAFNPGSLYYSEYASLRRNLAILRNYLMVQHPPQGPDGEVNLRRLQRMATDLGRALLGDTVRLKVKDKWWQALIRLSLTDNSYTGPISKEHLHKLALEMVLTGKKNFRDIPVKEFMHAVHGMMRGKEITKLADTRFLLLANTPDRGITFMYDYLHQLENIPVDDGGYTAKPSAPRDWKLLPLEETPFSSKDMLRYSRSYVMGQITDAMELVTDQMRSVDDMSYYDKEMAVEEARKILKYMRILATGKELKRVDVEDHKVDEARDMLQMALNFRGAMSSMVQEDPNLINDPQLRDSTEAFEKIAFRMKIEERRMLKEEGRHEAANALDQRINKTPGKYKTKEPMKALLQKIEVGFNRLLEFERKIAFKTKRTVESVRHKDLNKNVERVRTMREGLDNTMSGGKIAQISEPGMVGSAAQANETQQQERGTKENTAGSGMSK